MAEISEIYGEVTFYLKTSLDTAPLMAKARELDEENNGLGEVDLPEEYTLTQALQVVWHNDPQWLHDNVLTGWTLNRAQNEAGRMSPIWEEQG